MISYELPEITWVDAIEEGQIVKVTEQYARYEGLPIIRRYIPEKKEIKYKEEPAFSLNEWRKPAKKQQSQVMSELADNFKWLAVQKRRMLNLTRKQVANEIGESVNAIKLIENGMLPREDFVIINKLQKFLGVNLRKDKKDFEQSPRSLIDKPSSPPSSQPSQPSNPQEKKPSVSEPLIEIVDE